LWIGTSNRGIIRFEREKQILINYFNPCNNINSIVDGFAKYNNEKMRLNKNTFYNFKLNRVFEIFEDKDNVYSSRIVIFVPANERFCKNAGPFYLD